MTAAELVSADSGLWADVYAAAALLVGAVVFAAVRALRERGTR